MKKMRKTMIISLAVMQLSSTVFAGVLSPKAQENMETAFMSSFTGGLVLAGTFGAGAAGLALANSAMILGLSLGANGLSSSTESEQNLKMVKEVINKEAADYQMTGEIGLALGAAVNSLKTSYPEISDAEAIDSLVAAVN